MPTRAGEPLAWGSVHDRRRVMAIMATMVGPADTSGPRFAREAVDDPEAMAHERLEMVRSLLADVTPARIISSRDMIDMVADVAPDGTFALIRPTRARAKGRPKGTRTFSKAQLVAEYRRVSVAIGRAPTQDDFRASLSPPIELRTLQEHLTEYGLPWPIE